MKYWGNVFITKYIIDFFRAPQKRGFRSGYRVSHSKHSNLKYLCFVCFFYYFTHSALVYYRCTIYSYPWQCPQVRRLGGFFAFIFFIGPFYRTPKFCHMIAFNLQFGSNHLCILYLIAILCVPHRTRHKNKLTVHPSNNNVISTSK